MKIKTTQKLSYYFNEQLLSYKQNKASRFKADIVSINNINFTNNSLITN